MINIQQQLRRLHILTALLHQRFNRNDLSYSATLIITLTLWINLIAAMLLSAVLFGTQLPRISTEGSGLLIIIALLWGGVFGLNKSIGDGACYRREARRLIRQMGKSKNTWLACVAAWLVASYLLILPFALLCYGLS